MERRARGWLLLVPPLLAAVVAFAALAWTSEGFTAGGGVDAFLVGTVLWNVGPGLALAGVAVGVVRARAGRRGRVAVLAGSVVLLVFVGLATADVVWSESSTAALGFLFLPLFAWLIVLGTGFAVLLVSLRRERATSPPGRP